MTASTKSKPSSKRELAVVSHTNQQRIAQVLAWMQRHDMSVKALAERTGMSAARIQQALDAVPPPFAQ